MRKFPNFGARPASGFTLIELMVVILIVAILTIIAVPSYRSQTLKSHRTEAKSTLMDLAAREERFLATNGVYSGTATDLGLSAWGSVGNGYYTVAISNVTAAAAGSATTAATPAKFTLTATATSVGNQTQDTKCNSFTIDQSGLQSSAPATTGCW